MKTINCKCDHCSSFIEFEASEVGQTFPCPHCGMETILRNRVPPKLVKSSRKRWIWLCAITALAVLIPFSVYMFWEKVLLAVGVLGGGLIGFAILLFAVILSLLWTLFPMVTYFQLKYLIEEARRSNRLLAVIADNSKELVDR